MKKLMLLLSVLVCYTVYSQETDTILYSYNECSEPVGDQKLQRISFTLENDTLAILGDIIANCCGVHFIIYEIYTDSIHLARLDTGALCDCYCLQDINLKIGNCTSNSYKLFLSEYSGNDGIDTIVNANQTSIFDNSLNEKKNRCFPNPFNEDTYINYYLPDEVNKATIYIYDLQGRQVKAIDINERGNGSAVIHGSELYAGTYHYTLITDGQIVGTYTMILTN